MQSPRTVWSATLHPFTEDGALDEDAFRAHLRRFVAAGVGVNCANEASGEAFTLTRDEVRRILRIVRDECVGKVYTRGMGRMARTAAEMVAFVQEVELAGLDGIHIYQLDLGHGAVPTEAEQEAYLNEVLAVCHLPTMLSIHNAARYRYPVGLLQRMADRYPMFRELVVLSEGMGMTDDGYLTELYLALGRERLRIFVPTSQVLHSFAMGGAGFAAPEANLIPQTCAAFARLCSSARYAEALSIYRVITEINHRLRPFASPSGRKATLTFLGKPMGLPRPPRLPLSEQKSAELHRVLQELDLDRLEQTYASI